ncbi:MAG TPA: serine hydrolase domain-containing protein [Thermoanaerobaculia bacterium]|nr:serine hydrolase domain-containing protein [Thermoanaerobaculia bacterium]
MSVTLPTAEQIAEIVKPLLAENIGVAVGVTSPDFDGPAYFFNGSVTARDGSPLTLNSGTLFAIGSCSKTFTATLYATAIVQNDGVLNQLLGNSTPAGATPVGSNYTSIPLGSLANYTSGLPQDNQGGVPEMPPNQTTPYTVDELFTFLGTNPFPLAAPPETVYAYSNLGFSLLGAVTPGLLGQTQACDTWERALNASILTPLGMTLNTIDQVSPSLLPQSYYGSTKAGPIPLRYPAFNPGGGLVFSSSDVMRWLQYSMGMTSSAGLDDLLEWTQLPSTTLKASPITSIGRGWFLGSNGHVFKDGGILGFSSFIAFEASSDVGVNASPAGAFLLVNQSIKPSPYVSKILALMTGTELGDVATPETGAEA